MSTTDFACATCYDTYTIDQGGREIACPDCSITVEISGLSHGLGGYAVRYATAVVACSTDSRITFRGTKGAILADVRHVRASKVAEARRLGKPGRTAVSSWAIAIEKHVVAKLARI